MKKIFIILALTVSYALDAAIGSDQLVQVTFPRSTVMERAIEICKERGFTHFLLRKYLIKIDAVNYYCFKVFRTTGRALVYPKP